MWVSLYSMTRASFCFNGVHLYCVHICVYSIRLIHTYVLECASCRCKPSPPIPQKEKCRLQPAREIQTHIRTRTRPIIPNEKREGLVCPTLIKITIRETFCTCQTITYIHRSVSKQLSERRLEKHTVVCWADSASAIVMRCTAYCTFAQCVYSSSCQI